VSISPFRLPLSEPHSPPLSPSLPLHSKLLTLPDDLHVVLKPLPGRAPGQVAHVHAAVVRVGGRRPFRGSAGFVVVFCKLKGGREGGRGGGRMRVSDKDREDISSSSKFRSTPASVSGKTPPMPPPHKGMTQKLEQTPPNTRLITPPPSLKHLSAHTGAIRGPRNSQIRNEGRRIPCSAVLPSLPSSLPPPAPTNHAFNRHI